MKKTIVHHNACWLVWFVYWFRLLSSGNASDLLWYFWQKSPSQTMQKHDGVVKLQKYSNKHPTLQNHPTKQLYVTWVFVIDRFGNGGWCFKILWASFPDSMGFRVGDVHLASAHQISLASLGGQPINVQRVTLTGHTGWLRWWILWAWSPQERWWASGKCTSPLVEKFKAAAWPWNWQRSMMDDQTRCCMDHNPFKLIGVRWPGNTWTVGPGMGFSKI